MMTPTDEFLPTSPTLLEKIKNPKDRMQWVRFVNTYKGFIWGRARKDELTDADCDEVLQLVLIAVGEHIEELKYDPKRSFKGWLMTTTFWRIKDVQRGNLRARGMLNDEQQKAAEDTAVPLEWGKAWEEESHRVALERLKETATAREFQLFEAKQLQGLPTEEVCSRYAATGPAVSMAVHKCKKKLGEIVKAIVEGADLPVFDYRPFVNTLKSMKSQTGSESATASTND